MSLEKTIINLLLKLPDPILLSLAGGTPVVRDGRTLDARFQFIAHSVTKRGAPPELTTEFARHGTEILTVLFGGPLEQGVSYQDRTLQLSSRTIPARSYRPSNQNPQAPLLVFYHFGGGVVGSLETCHAFCSILAKTIGCPVLSVDYRLAPEHPWPAGLEDAIDSFLWARDHAQEFGAPAGVAAVGGDSMGGNFSAILAQEMQRRELPQPFLQLLIYPATTILATEGSMQSCADAYPLTADIMAWFMANYLPNSNLGADLRVSPALAPSLASLAPAIVITAGHDPLRDQGKAYAEALEAAEVKVHYQCYDSLAHGFTAYTGGVPAADRACREIAAVAARAYRAMGG
jgi:acetyl esterase/lipase